MFITHYSDTARECITLKGPASNTFKQYRCAQFCVEYPRVPTETFEKTGKNHTFK